MSESYGHAYLTSYGWTGSGTGLRKGAIDKPLAIPPKKNLSGLGKDRDDAFPFWDHLFTAASKAIKIKVSSDDEDVDDTEPEDPSSYTDPLRRTTTGIISNRRPLLGTSASSTSGSTTPNPNTLTDAGTNGRLSLLATAKREAAKRILYAQFFRGPVLGPPGDDPHPRPLSSGSESESISTSVPERVGDQDNIVEEPKKSKKSTSEGKAETREERRERKKMKKERKAARAAKRAEKALAREKAKRKKDRLDVDRKTRMQRDNETWSEENEKSLHPKKGCKQARKSVAGPEGLALSNNGQQDTSHRPPSNVDATDAFSVVLAAKKKRKRKDTPP